MIEKKGLGIIRDAGVYTTSLFLSVLSVMAKENQDPIMVAKGLGSNSWAWAFLMKCFPWSS